MKCKLLLFALFACTLFTEVHAQSYQYSPANSRLVSTAYLEYDTSVAQYVTYDTAHYYTGNSGGDFTTSQIKYDGDHQYYYSSGIQHNTIKLSM